MPIKDTSTSTTVNERVHFKVFVMPCCSHMLCWVNPRYPSYCPSCGASVYPQVKGAVTLADDDAHLRYDTAAESAPQSPRIVSPLSHLGKTMRDRA